MSPLQRQSIVSRRVLALAAAATLLAAILLLGYRLRYLRGEHVPAPHFTLKALDGTEVSLGQYRGRRLVLDFWSTTCSVCRGEIATMQALQDDLPDNTVLLSIANDDDPETVRQFVKQRQITYPVLMADEHVLSDYNVRSYPTLFFITPKGEIHTRKLEPSNGLDLLLRIALSG
jgi:peroxiredoxin